MSKSPETLTAEECEKFVNHFNKSRNKLMVLLMLDAGLRVGELVQLEKTDLFRGNLPVAAIRVRAEIAKNHRERIVPCGGRIIESIVKVMQVHWQLPHYEDTGFAFYTKNSDVHITARQVQRIVKQAAEKSIGRAIHPHVLRHTFASRLMRCTNARVVQELLGHKNLATTQIYMHPNHEDLTKAINSMA